MPFLLRLLVVATLACLAIAPQPDPAIAVPAGSASAQDARWAIPAITDVLLRDRVAYLAVGRHIDAYDLSAPEAPRWLGRASVDEDLVQLAFDAPWIVAGGATGIHLFRPQPGREPRFVLSVLRPAVEGALTEWRPGEPHSFFLEAHGGELIVAGSASIKNERGEAGPGSVVAVQRARLGEDDPGPWRETWRRTFEADGFSPPWSVTALGRAGDGAILGVYASHRQVGESALVHTPSGSISQLRPAQRAEALLVDGDHTVVAYRQAGIASGREEFVTLAVVQDDEIVSALPYDGPAGLPTSGAPAALDGSVANLWTGMRTGWLLRLDAHAAPRPRTRAQIRLPERIRALAVDGTFGVAVLSDGRAVSVSLPDEGRGSWWPLAQGGSVSMGAAHRLSLPLLGSNGGMPTN